MNDEREQNVALPERIINGERVFIKCLRPGQEIYDARFDCYHQFPGVVSSIVFPKLEFNQTVQVSASRRNNATFDLILDRTCFNYHVCNNRFVFGTLLAAAVDDDVADALAIGDVISLGKNFVSVVTALHRVDERNWLVPVTGVRSDGDVSGHMIVPNGVRAERIRPDAAVYGTAQMPYDAIKRYIAETASKDDNACGDASTCVIFYGGEDDEIVRVTYNRGERELVHLRMRGPLVKEINKKLYN